jgi:diguanylate cyclase (GGDEF)-like protein
VFLFNTAGNQLEPAVMWGDIPADDQTYPPDDCQALRSSEASLHDAPHKVMCKHVHGKAAEHYLCIPLISQGAPLGALHLRSTLPLAEKTGFAQLVSEHIGLALVNIKLQEKLREQSIRDPLTGLFNRRYMEEFLQSEERRALRSGAPIGIIMFDVDHFKQLNDTHGHAAGDYVLRALAQMLIAHIREGDIVCRYGGEEFIVILPGASLEITRDRAEALRKLVAEVVIDYVGRSSAGVTISLGVACFPAHGSTSEEVLQRADKALYAAKKAGRNQVVLA